MTDQGLVRAQTKLLVLASATLCLILILGLWPFHAPKNQVSWATNTPGLYFGDDSTVLSSNPFPTPPSDDGCTLEIWLQPRQIGGTSTLLSFYSAANPQSLALLQYGHELILRIDDESAQNRESAKWFPINNVFQSNKSVFVTITSGRMGTAVYVDGFLVARSSTFLISRKELSGTLVFANSPFQNDSWSGLLRGLAIYHSEISAGEVQEHQRTWTHRGQPVIAPAEQIIALFLIREGKGNVVHNESKRGVDLYIPEHFVVLHETFLESPAKEFRLTFSYWLSVLKNIVGFIPLGFFSFAYLLARHTKRSTLAAILLGAAASLTIEILQAYLPTRDSGVTDLITNTFGTAVGVALFRYRPLKSLLEWVLSAQWKAREINPAGASVSS